MLSRKLLKFFVQILFGHIFHFESLNNGIAAQSIYGAASTVQKDKQKLGNKVM